MAKEEQEDDDFYIVFEENCKEGGIEDFIDFLETYKLLVFNNSTKTENINGKNIKFAKIDFRPDFMKRSEYVDRLKFQLAVKKEDEIIIEVQDDTPANVRENDSLIGKGASYIEWIIKSAKDDENLTKYLETFELRRNNTEIFYEKDLRSYLTRGIILSSIFNDPMESEIENFLRSVREKIKEETVQSKKQILEILEEDKNKCTKNYSGKIILDVKSKFQNDDFENIAETKEYLYTLLSSEIIKYGNYNSVRNQITVFPLHRDLDRDHPLKKWISLKNCFGRQPLSAIKDYFGVKVATYFVWAGFYTYMLIIASILGLLCIIFGLTVLPYSKLSRDICTSEVVMCPRCDMWCDYWKLKDTCTYSALHHAIDNLATIIYAVFMSVWSALYLRHWQRYLAKFNTNWDVINFDHSSQLSRREYVKDVRKAVKLYRMTLSFFICLLWVLLSLGMVFALILYRMSLITSEKLYGDRNSYSIYVVPISTAILDLIGIQILNFIYGKIALYLTEIENHRTESDYENSLSIKLFMFQFVNYYSAIFYIAIFKGKFTGTPAKYTRVFGFRQEECNPGGCLVELAIQLGIIMTGRQAIKLAAPHVLFIYTELKKSYYRRNMNGTKNEGKLETQEIPDYVKNYNLKKFDFITLMPEYLEMVIQFGFVTLFVAAFPLAPLFALLNNILEVRLDGRKFLIGHRRPLPSRVKGIGVWLNIMSILTRIAAASNAIIIAFSSHFIPKWVYKISYSPDHSFEGYLNHSLAIFNTKDFEPQSVPQNSDYGNISTCYYLQYRNSPDDDHKYKKHIIYWHMMAIRLTFIVIYQFCISLIVITVEYAVPSVPKKVKTQLKKNARSMMERERGMMNDLTEGEPMQLKKS